MLMMLDDIAMDNARVFQSIVIIITSTHLAKGNTDPISSIWMSVVYLNPQPSQKFACCSVFSRPHSGQYTTLYSL